MEPFLMMVFKRNLLFKGAILRFHVKLWEGMEKSNPPVVKISGQAALRLHPNRIRSPGDRLRLDVTDRKLGSMVRINGL